MLSDCFQYNQIELLYANETRWMCEWNFNDTNPIGTPGSLSSQANGFGAGASRMSTYWPNSILQDSLGRLYELMFTVSIGWHHQYLYLTPNLTGVAMLPNDPKLEH